MSTSLVVFRPRKWWAPTQSDDMDRTTVDSTLGRLLNGLSDVVRTPGDVLELDWHGQRVGSQWTITYGRRGVRRVVASIWDDNLDETPDAYRDELRAVVGPLQALASATHARLLVGGEDLTDASVNDVVDLLA